MVSVQQRSAPAAGQAMRTRSPHQTRGPARTVYHARPAWSRDRPIGPGGNTKWKPGITQSVTLSA
nr:MAG TPA: hypothetical protein [Caudoviricetes sp.]